MKSMSYHHLEAEPVVEDVGRKAAEILQDALLRDREAVSSLLGFSVFCSQALAASPDLIGSFDGSGNVTLSVLGLLNSIAGTSTHRLVTVYDGQGQLTKIVYAEWPLTKEE